MEKLLEVQNLRICFHTEDGIIAAVNGVSFDVKPGEILGIVGESGCGKSVTSLSILGLVPRPPGEILEGSILFEGRNLLRLSDKEIREIRGNEIAMIFQDPVSSLNPVLTIGNQISETIALHQGLDAGAAWKQSAEMLNLVGIPHSQAVLHRYPHSLSVGMCQRVMIAMALSCNPRLLIADEPSTALDTTIQAQILELMKDMKEKINASVILITHDLGVIAEMAEHVLVMYAGVVVEDTDVVTAFKNPLHPYTAGLLKATPGLEEEKETLDSIPGTVPDPLNLPPGCFFHPRCPRAMEICRIQMPSLWEIQEGHRVRCWLYRGKLGGGK